MKPQLDCFWIWKYTHPHIFISDCNPWTYSYPASDHGNTCVHTHTLSCLQVLKSQQSRYAPTSRHIAQWPQPISKGENKYSLFNSWCLPFAWCQHAFGHGTHSSHTHTHTNETKKGSGGNQNVKINLSNKTSHKSKQKNKQMYKAIQCAFS